MQYKVCKTCENELPITSFFKKRNSTEGSCKQCRMSKRKTQRQNDPTIDERSKERYKERLVADPEFAESQRLYRVDYYQKNKAKHNALTSAWKKRNPDSHKETYKKWCRANKDRVRYYANKRRTAKLRATPKWADDEFEQLFIQEIYHLAVLRETCLGGSFEVDHIVPLQSKVVCGLHCMSNLQILPASVNGSKSNRFWPDMP